MKKDDLPKGVRKIVRGGCVTYVAQYRENNIQFSKTFNVKKYGDELACKMACEFRKQKENELMQKYYKNIYSDKGSRYVLTIISDRCTVDVLISKEDFSKVSQHKWYIGHIDDNRHTTQIITIIKQRAYDIRYFILGIPNDNNVIYKNKNEFDNRRENLKIVKHNHSGQINKKYKNPNNTSGVTGVYKEEYGNVKQWTAQITVNNHTYKKRFSIKRYGDEDAYKMACEARNMLAEKYENYNA